MYMSTEPCPYCGRRIPATTTPIKKCGYCGGEWVETGGGITAGGGGPKPATA